ncbi:MAG: hypothetical protein HWN68_10790 [Desulfobacterales bacterium]|nr:hypothetical protein [Desulfobacterales bacterium]
MPIQYISLKEILEKNIAHGGKSALITGKPDSGKTGLLHGLSSRIVENEICIFRGLKTGQEFRFPGHLNIIAFQCRPKFYDMKGKELDVGLKIINSNYHEVLKACVLGKLNVLYFPFEKERSYWVGFARFLIQRFPADYASSYVSLFIDEAEEIIPPPEKGKFRDTEEFVGALKEFRKTLISIYAATQQYFDVFWRAIGKINYKIYLRGAIVPRRISRVHQETVDSLPLGRGVLTGSFFGFFTFGNYPTRKLVIVR